MLKLEKILMKIHSLLNLKPETTSKGYISIEELKKQAYEGKHKAKKIYELFIKGLRKMARYE